MPHMQGQGVCTVCMSPCRSWDFNRGFYPCLLGNTVRKVKSGLTMKASAQVNFGVHGRFLQSFLLYSAFSFFNPSVVWLYLGFTNHLWLHTMDRQNDIIWRFSWGKMFYHLFWWPQKFPLRTCSHRESVWWW